MKAFVLIAALFLLSNTAQAQYGRDIVTGPHDGKMQESAGVEMELLVGDREVTLCLYERSVPMDIRNYKAVVTVVSGANREQIELRPYSALSLELTPPNGPTAIVKF